MSGAVVRTSSRAAGLMLTIPSPEIVYTTASRFIGRGVATAQHPSAGLLPVSLSAVAPDFLEMGICMNNDSVDSNGNTSTFGLACSKLLMDLEKASSSQPFVPIEQSQYRLAKLAAERIPHSLLVVDPDDETTFLVTVDEYECSQPKYVYLRNFHSNGRNRYETRIDGYPNSGAIEATKGCIKGWLDWDVIQPKNATEFIVLKSNDIQVQYDLKSKTIARWADDSSKSFIQKTDKKGYYKIVPSAPELIGKKTDARHNRT